MRAPPRYCLLDTAVLRESGVRRERGSAHTSQRAESKGSPYSPLTGESVYTYACLFRPKRCTAARGPLGPSPPRRTSRRSYISSVCATVCEFDARSPVRRPDLHGPVTRAPPLRPVVDGTHASGVSASGSDAEVVLLVGVRGEGSSSARRASERVVVPVVVPEGPPAKRAHHRPVHSHGTSKQVHGPLHLALS